MFTKQDLINEIKKNQEEELKLIIKKNADYSSEQDPLQNFRMFGEYGFLVRMSDKLSRATQIIKSGKVNVKNESIIDTLQDLANYSNLLIAYLNERK